MRLTRLQQRARYGDGDVLHCLDRKSGSVASRSSPRLALEKEHLERQYGGIVFSLVLHGHIHDDELKRKYASKFLHNIRTLLIEYPGCLVVLYYDESTPLAFLQAVRPLREIRCVYFKKPEPSCSIMFARLLELDRRPGGCADLVNRPDRTWVFTLDGHEELDNMPSTSRKRKGTAEPGNMMHHRAMVKACLGAGAAYSGAALHWNEMDTTPPRPPRLFPGRTPSLVLDAGGIGMPVAGYEKRPPIEPLVRHFCTQYAYGYALDELLIDEWFNSCFGGKWWQSHDLYLSSGDPESDLDVSCLEILSPTAVGSRAVLFADETIKWDVPPATAQHPRTRKWQERKEAQYATNRQRK